MLHNTGGGGGGGGADRSSLPMEVLRAEQGKRGTDGEIMQLDLEMGRRAEQGKPGTGEHFL